MTDPIAHLSASGHLDQIFVDGCWRAPHGGGRASVIDPASEAEVAQIALGDGEDVDSAVAAARRAFDGWSNTPVDGRVALLRRIHALLLDRADLFARAISLEMGSAITAARAAQVPRPGDPEGERVDEHAENETHAAIIPAARLRHRRRALG